jgi:hypothetical protein
VREQRSDLAASKRENQDLRSQNDEKFNRVQFSAPFLRVSQINIVAIAEAAVVSYDFKGNLQADSVLKFTSTFQRPDKTF